MVRSSIERLWVFIKSYLFGLDRYCSFVISFVQVVRQVQNSTQRKMVVELFINSKSVEWAWRSLTYWKKQPMNKTIVGKIIP